MLKLDSSMLSKSWKKVERFLDQLLKNAQWTIMHLVHDQIYEVDQDILWILYS